MDGEWGSSGQIERHSYYTTLTGQVCARASKVSARPGRAIDVGTANIENVENVGNVGTEDRKVGRCRGDESKGRGRYRVKGDTSARSRDAAGGLDEAKTKKIEQRGTWAH
jgi:hypothetical protein